MASIDVVTSRASARSAAIEEWKAGWPLPLVGALGFYMLSILAVSTGAFMAPLQAAFGWNRAQFSACLTISAVASIPLLPLGGAVIDRFGGRAVGTIGGIVTGASICLSATATHSLFQWYVLWVVYTAVSQLISPILWSGAVASVFSVSRGLAMSVTMVGSALAAMTGPVAANALIEHFDFRAAFLVMGLVPGVAVSVACWFVVPGRGGRDRAAKAAMSEAPSQPLAGMSLGQGLKSAAFIKLALIVVLVQFVLLTMIIHIIPLLSGAGLTRNVAVMAAGSYGVSMLVGKFAAGFAMDRLPARLVLAGLVAMLAVSLAMLALPTMTITWALCAVLMFGFPYGGTAPLWPYLVSRYFGLRSFGRLYGFLSSFFGVALFFGPWTAGFLFDRTHSYRLFLLGSIPALLLAIVLAISLGRYPTFAEPQAAGDA